MFALCFFLCLLLLFFVYVVSVLVVVVVVFVFFVVDVVIFVVFVVDVTIEYKHEYYYSGIHLVDFRGFCCFCSWCFFVFVVNVGVFVVVFVVDVVVVVVHLYLISLFLFVCFKNIFNPPFPLAVSVASSSHIYITLNSQFVAFPFRLLRLFNNYNIIQN